MSKRPNGDDTPGPKSTDGDDTPGPKSTDGGKQTTVAKKPKTMTSKRNVLEMLAITASETLPELNGARKPWGGTWKVNGKSFIGTLQHLHETTVAEHLFRAVNMSSAINSSLEAFLASKEKFEKANEHTPGAQHNHLKFCGWVDEIDRLWIKDGHGTMEAFIEAMKCYMP